MLFNAEYDRALWLLVASNKDSMEKIAKLISYIPQNVYDEIQIAIYNYVKVRNLDSVIFSKSFSGNDEFDYYVVVRLKANELIMDVRRWKEENERLEEDYELSLSAVSKEDLKNMKVFERGYVGSYSHEFNKIQFIKNLTSVSTEDWNRDYVLLSIPFGYMIGSCLNSHLAKLKIVNVARKMPDDINAQDFSSIEKVDKLVRSKKRKRSIFREVLR